MNEYNRGKKINGVLKVCTFCYLFLLFSNLWIIYFKVVGFSKMSLFNCGIVFLLCVNVIYFASV